jgi:hypothetical protein
MVAPVSKKKRIKPSVEEDPLPAPWLRQQVAWLGPWINGPELFFAPAQTLMMTPAGSATHVTELLTARHCGARCCIERGSCGTHWSLTTFFSHAFFPLFSIHLFNFIPFHGIPFIH